MASLISRDRGTRFWSADRADGSLPITSTRMPRATFALMLALLPMFATVIGAIVLHQVPTVQDLAGISLVIVGVALHHG